MIVIFGVHFLMPVAARGAPAPAQPALPIPALNMAVGASNAPQDKEPLPIGTHPTDGNPLPTGHGDVPRQQNVLALEIVR